MVRSVTGLTARRIRYYERRGLIGEVERSPANQRRYDRTQIAQLQEIAEYRRQGFSIRQIEALLDPETSPEELRSWAETLEAEARATWERAELFRQAAQERHSFASSGLSPVAGCRR